MDKISAYTTTADSNDEFTEGNPSTSTPATEVDAGWLNAFQRELVQLIESMGIALDPNDDTLIWQAFRKIYGRTNSGDPNGALAADVVRERCWDTSTSPPTLYIATAADGTVGGTTWTTLAGIADALTSGDLAANGGPIAERDNRNNWTSAQDFDLSGEIFKHEPFPSGTHLTLQVSPVGDIPGATGWDTDTSHVLRYRQTSATDAGGNNLKGFAFTTENQANQLAIDFDNGIAIGSSEFKGSGTAHADELWENDQRIGPIETATVELGGDFDVGVEVYCRRDGERVTITGIGALSHASGTDASTAGVGTIPSQFRPSSNIQDAHTNVGFHGTIRVNADGSLSVLYSDETFNNVSRTDTGLAPTISYLIT